MLLKYAEDWLDRNDLFLYLWKNYGFHYGSSYTLKIPRKIVCGLHLTKKDIMEYFNYRYFLMRVTLLIEDSIEII